ncbi:MAG: helix-turn-helix transcriptional regulator [Actinobacteria bacterium]|nr:helix-turn-helix transcriptional regulator [Actinomycetota bacterium]
MRATSGAPPVDDAFGVIAHPIRRLLLERLARGEQRVSDLAEPLPVSRPAVSQHLRLMLDVGVVSEIKRGRERYYSLEPDSLAAVDAFLARLDEFWAAALERLGRHLDDTSS